MAVDVATRSICAGVLRPAATKAVDAALLLARVLVPEPMRPGWPEALGMAHSAIPHVRLMSIDARLERAAAKPVIVPDTIVIDHGRVFISEAFLRACQTLGISVQPAHPRTPTDKSVVERTFQSVNTLFCQHVRAYKGANTTMRGAGVDADAVWTVGQLQDLFDEWVVAGWQPRPHDALRHPLLGGRALSPNEMYGALVASAGYLPVTLCGDDYLELLPAEWRSIQDYGVRLDHRTYDCAALNPYRRQPSGVQAKRGLWEVHYDPYDLSHVWVRDHHAGGWITVPWTQLPMVARPFADFTWRKARELAAARGLDDTDQAQGAAVLAELLQRAGSGPPREQRVVARTRAAAATSLRPEPQFDSAAGLDAEHGTDNDQPASGEVVPLGVFDPLSEAAWP
jgi:hypothetical protein